MSALDPGLREELLHMAEVDQDARRHLDRHPGLDQGVPEQELTAAERADLDHLRAVDASNTARMRTIIGQHGWPGRSLVGDDGAQAAWLGHAVKAGQADAGHHAYLTDRVLLAEGNQQLYGTQVMLVGGTWQPRPSADPDRVDDRRRQVGLEPLADYLRRFEQLSPQGGDE